MRMSSFSTFILKVFLKLSFGGVYINYDYLFVIIFNYNIDISFDSNSRLSNFVYYETSRYWKS